VSFIVLNVRVLNIHVLSVHLAHHEIE